ncbi:RHS repeat-associated core domain-containing protein [Pseudomonas fulva]|uniref:RHS repeat-associated core domain-containing protein n=1 Tax=Pseudomonas fulva TaxID=47880 RepID=UPI001E62DF4F
MKKADGQRRLAQQRLSYTAYGDLPARVITGLGFNGELRDGFIHAYALGNGHRCYCAALMRFFSPDALSPFNQGGVNAYAYCQGDPINRLDPTGAVGILKRYPGRARQVAQVRPVKAVPLEAIPVNQVSKKGPGKYLQARTTSLELVVVGGSELTGGFSGASVKVPPVQEVAGVKSQGPTIDQLGDYWRDHWHWEHRPGTQPMRLDQMIPNHQRAQNNQVAQIEHRMALVREQAAVLEIEVQVLSSFGHW